MTLVSSQVELVSSLAQLIVDQVDADYDELSCTYEYVPRYDTISSSLMLTKDGLTRFPDTRAGFATESLHLCERLREKPQDESTKKWISLVIWIDSNRSVESRFGYDALEGNHIVPRD